MKNKYVICIIALLVISFQLQAQSVENKKKKTEMITIQTSGHCHSCKEKIENGLAFEKGIRDVEYEISTAKIRVTYNPQKTNPNTIRKIINDLGYDTDELKAAKIIINNCKQDDNNTHEDH